MPSLHKTQGATIQKVLIDLVDSGFANGQRYVAFSRVKSAESCSVLNTFCGPVTADLLCSIRTKKTGEIKKSVLETLAEWARLVASAGFQVDQEHLPEFQRLVCFGVSARVLLPPI